MRVKHDSRSETVPGPGQYEQRSQLVVKERGHDFGKDSRSKMENSRVPGPGSYEYENAVFKYGSKMEPSYGFGSRLTLNNERYIAAYSVEYLVQVHMNQKRKSIHISGE